MLKWLRRSSGIIPNPSMSDCVPAISQKVSWAYADLGYWAPKHYWCIFHVLKDFKGCVICYLECCAEEAIKEFHTNVYSSSNPKHQLEQMCLKCFLISHHLSNIYILSGARLSISGLHGLGLSAMCMELGGSNGYA